MTDPEDKSEHEALESQARQWVTRLSSGNVTVDDAEALDRWRRSSPAHRQAFAEASLLWQKLGPAAVESLSRNQSVRSRSPAQPARRVFLGGAIAASASIGVAIARPPLGLWPSLSELAADYRTGIGQQQQIALDDNASLKLNTRTSIAMLSPEGGAARSERIELVAGELSITTAAHNTRPFVVVAAQGRTVGSDARFNIRHIDSTVCVTCLAGDVRVEHLGQATKLAPGQQVNYTAQSLGEAAGVDPEMVTAWERGLLVFRNDPLVRVLDEVNRYRPGKIIMMNEELGQRPVLATFRIDRIDEVVPRLQTVFGIQARALPGGIVLVS